MKMKWYEAAKAIMKNAGVNQDTLAEHLGITKGAVSHWLNARREPSIEDIAKIFNFLGREEFTVYSNGEISLDPEGEEIPTSNSFSSKAKITQEEEDILEIFKGLPDEEAKRFKNEMKARKAHFDAIFEEMLKKRQLGA